MLWSRDEERRRARSEESDDERDNWKKEERETEDKIEGCVQKRHADGGTESGRGRRRGVLESEDQQPYRRLQMTGKARDEEEDRNIASSLSRLAQNDVILIGHHNI